MKRRQVLAGLFAVGAAGFLAQSSRPARQMLSPQMALSEEPLTIDKHDIDPPLVDPISDHENRAINRILTPSHWSLSPLDSTINKLEAARFDSQRPMVDSFNDSQSGDVSADNSVSDDDIAHMVEVQSVNAPDHSDASSTAMNSTAINKQIYFEKDYADDIFVRAEDKALLHSVHLRLKKLQSQIGYGHFNIVNFDDVLVFAKRYQAVGSFTQAELDFIENIFATNAADYGFYGEKVVDSLTAMIEKKQAIKVPHTGHYLFKDQSYQYYEKLRKNVGEGIVLTSGIRSNVKQLHLFLAKVVSVNGNLSRASRSLAPPGYSYHGIGDFDVGRKGWGGKNFTDAFSQTEEFKRMQDLGYVAIRYDQGNTLGVRFEPWHIKVV